MNSLNFTGNLGKDAEQRFTQDGKSIVSFSAALKAGYGDKATTTWVKCSLFGKQGESLLPYLTKGQLVGVVGELSAREWDNKEGVKQTSIECRVNDVTLLGSKQDRPAQKEAPQRNSQGAPPSKDDLGDDIPFAKRKDY